MLFSEKIFYQSLILDCRKECNEYRMWDLEGIFHNCGSWGLRKMKTCTILGLYAVFLFTKGLSCSSLYLTLLLAPCMGAGVDSMIATVRMRKPRFPGWLPQQPVPSLSQGHGHGRPCREISGVVRTGWRCKVIPQIAILGRLAVLHELTFTSGSGTLLTSLSRFNLAPGPGFPRFGNGTTIAWSRGVSGAPGTQPASSSQAQAGRKLSWFFLVPVPLMLEPVSPFMLSCLLPLILCHGRGNVCFLTLPPLPLREVSKTGRKVRVDQGQYNEPGLGSWHQYGDKRDLEFPLEDLTAWWDGWSDAQQSEWVRNYIWLQVIENPNSSDLDNSLFSSKFLQVWSWAFQAWSGSSMMSPGFQHPPLLLLHCLL